MMKGFETRCLNKNISKINNIWGYKKTDQDHKQQCWSPGILEWCTDFLLLLQNIKIYWEVGDI